ncbi:excinuclease ABC subunit C [Actinobacillus equuli]|nr:excinuclease ABC subunit C [Actinobacillus equuli]
MADTFVGQFYLQMNQHRTIPNQIIIDQPLSEAAALANVLSEQAGHKVSIVDKNIRGDKSRYLALAKTNAEAALTLQLKQDTHIRHRYDSLKALLNLAEIKRMECFDISHTMGNQTVASCVVFDENGPLKSDYRRFNIEGITGGDDYAAMEQALLKRYDRNLEEEKSRILFLLTVVKGSLIER